MVEAPALELYTRWLEAESPAGCRVRFEDGAGAILPLDRWLAHPAPEEEPALARCRAPVLDVGCGPGRHVLELARRGTLAVGVDLAPGAVRLARMRGASVLEGSIFGRLPGAGTWSTALLLDGNIGIGGAPELLLRRLADLLRTDGVVVLEVEPPGALTRPRRVRLEAPGTVSPWFPWAQVGVDGVAALATRSGFSVHDTWRSGPRWFAELHRDDVPR